MPDLSPKKFRNSFVRIDGQLFHSKWEAEYWLALQLAEADGLIDRLRRQVAYQLIVNAANLGKAIIDFSFIEVSKGGYGKQLRLQDCKGYVRKGVPATSLWKLKYGIIQANSGIPVEIITRPRKKDLLTTEDQTFQGRLFSYLKKIDMDKIKPNKGT